jgi:hypothetical protein
MSAGLEFGTVLYLRGVLAETWGGVEGQRERNVVDEIT